ncbi:MAG TPA: ribosome biogenesis GTPase Der [Myxococcota bacterium]|nr:ribosome biogenesis GTPase Der [Myxococcota bacterium]
MAELPIVAIVGRPNVGKSTLFNRYAGRRRALVLDVPGVTRDRLVEEVEVGGRRLLLVDTAGLHFERDARIDAAVQAQAQAAIAQADAIVFVVDGQVGLLPEDEELARALRKTQKPLAVAVNKIDRPAHEARVGEFHALGFERVRGVSAEHGSGAFDLLEELVAELPAPGEPAGAPRAEGGALRVAIVGRPNAGKSSLLNQILGAERVVVSEEPGTTRDAIDIRVERDGHAFVFIDTAGLRRPGRRDRLAERGSALMALRAIEDADVALVVVDAAEGPTDQDARVLALVAERGRAAVVVLNKWDVVAADGPERAKRVRSELERHLPGLAHFPVVTLSAKTGRGLGRLFPAIRGLGEAFRRKIPTAELNRWLQETVALHEPAMAQRGTRKRPLKFFYATQTGVGPPTFTLFCTEPESVQPSYRRFLENRLRERFDFEGVPLRLRLRSRREREPGRGRRGAPAARPRPRSDRAGRAH